MADDTFDRLTENLRKVSQEIMNAYKEATLTEIKSAGDTFAQTLRATSGSDELNAQMDTSIVVTDNFISYDITWDDELIVNIEHGKSYGRDRDKPRERGKRNYSIRPATYHDLAYIINDGQKGFIGTKFINRARNKIRGWRKKRDALFRVKESAIAKEFE